MLKGLRTHQDLRLATYLTCREDDTGQPAQEPPAGEGGDGGEGRRGEAHHHVGQGHVADKQVDPWLQSSTLERRKYTRQCT